MEALTESCSLPLCPHQRDTLLWESNILLWFPWGSGQFTLPWGGDTEEERKEVCGWWRAKNIPEQGIWGLRILETKTVF